MKHALWLTAALTLCGATSHAAVVTANISQGTLGTVDPSNPGWSPPVSASASNATSVSLNADQDYPSTVVYRATQLADADAATGSMSARAEVALPGQAWTTVQWQDEVINTSGTSQAYALGINLSGMYLAVGGFTSDYTQRNSSASFMAEVLVNGSSVWSTQYTLGYNGQQREAILTQSGAELNGAGLSFQPNIYASGGKDNSFAELMFANAVVTQIDLGTFAHGESFSITYALKANATFADPGSCNLECSSADAFISDPIGASQTLLAIPVNAVPEPQSYLLIGLGLLAIGYATRRLHRPAF